MKNIQLEEAIDGGDADRVCSLLTDRAGLDLEKRDPVSGRTPLHRAIWRSAVHGDRRQHIIVGMLLKADASPNAGDRYGLMPLVTAAGDENLANFDLLLAYDADIYERHPLSTQTVVEQCADLGRPAVMERLHARAGFLTAAARETMDEIDRGIEERRSFAEGALRFAAEGLEGEELIEIGRPPALATAHRLAV